LGTGIYVLVGEAVGEAGNGVWLAFVVGAMVAAPTGLAFAELAAMFGRVSRTRRTPWVATVVITAMAVALATTGNIGFVAQVTNSAVFGLFTIVNAAVIVLRRNRPDVERPFRLWGSVNGVPVIAVLGLVGNLGLAAYMDRDAFVAGVGLLAIGLAASMYIVRYERRAVA
jgi:amino acid transporter